MRTLGKFRISTVLRIIVAVIGTLLYAMTAHAQNPVPVKTCDLAKSPKEFDGKQVSVRGKLNVFFEDFTLATTECGTKQSVWLAFGGDVPGVVPSMTNDNFRRAGSDLKVDGISYKMRKDENFRRLYALIAAQRGGKPEYRVTATLIGTFLAGSEQKFPGGTTSFGGYGHLGCCSLLVITQVADVESVPKANLHLRGRVLKPNGQPAVGLIVTDDIQGGSPHESQQTRTDENGEFKFEISGQLLRIEDAAYRPLAVAVKPGGSAVQLKLEDAAKSDWRVPACGKEPEAGKRIGFSTKFVLPNSMQFELEEKRDPSTYFVYRRGADTSDARLFVSRFEAESNDWNIEATGLRGQRWVKDSAGVTIGLDSRSPGRNSERRRFVNFGPRESANYNAASRQEAVEWDRILDSACLSAN